MVAAIGMPVLLACGGAAAPSASTSSATFAQPVTVKDCNGVQSTFTAPPKRVVTLTANVLELLFWLGVEKTVIGTGAPPEKGTLPTQYAAAAQRVPRLSGDYVPGAFKPVPREVLLAANPDFVIGDWPSNFTAAGATSQQELTDAHVNSYLAMSTSCTSALIKPQTDLELTFQDLANLGRVFGVEQRAQSLIAGMRSKLTDVHRQLGAVTAPSVLPFEYDEGTGTPSAPGNRQTINAIITLAGGRNTFADVDKVYQKTGWEEIARRNPDVILVITYAKPSAAEDRADQARADQFLETFGPIASMSAVRQKRIVHLIYEYGSQGGVRNADAVVQLASQLFPDRLKG
jgi:iron complex transport system substrate-binding protein